MAGEHFAQGGEDGGDGLAFHDVAARAGAHGAFGVEVFMVHRQDQDGQAGLPEVEILDEVQAVAFVHGQVRDDDVGPELGGGGEAGARVGGFAADGEVGLLVDDLGQAVAEEGMVVYDQDLTFAAGGSGLLVHGFLFRVGAARGSRQLTVVPRRGWLSMDKVAPMRPAR